MRTILTFLSRWFVGPFRNRRLLAFWLVTVIALGAIQGWLTYLSHQQVSAEEDSPYPLFGLAPSCDVLDIDDGDTMRLDCGWNEAKPQIITVRLYCIDAPELGQEPWGKLAHDYLRSITGPAVAIKPVEWDRNRRLVAIVHSKGGELNLRMVADGFAPVYPNYCRDQRYYDAESNTHARGTGIWSTPGVQQRPWEWRRTQFGREQPLK
jgi:endonuclease YncB( thermonuclease family)